MDAEELAAWIKAEAEGRVEKAAGQPIAIVGGGPAGLAAAHDLALMGFRPVIFEAERIPGGMLALGVPAYRLPRELIRWEISVIEALGAELRCGQSVGQHISFAQLRREYAAIILAVGAKRARRLGIPGENGPGVYGGVDLLRAVALGEPFPIGRRVVVIGGGNVAYDVARTVLRQVAWDTARTAARMEPGTGVKLVSLETLEEMPADTQEILEGDEEGIERPGVWVLWKLSAVATAKLPQSSFDDVCEFTTKTVASHLFLMMQTEYAFRVILSFLRWARRLTSIFWQKVEMT
jgi:NADPH-dependent glutamate synthase beta subunit-like oxidoreductase